MQQFLKVFLDIVLWRRGPQDLPSSGLLVAATLVAYELVTLLQIALFGVNSAELILFLVIDPLLLMGGLWLVLKLYGHSGRWPQAAAAVLGCTALMGLVLTLPMLLFDGARAAADPPPSLALLAICSIIAFILVVGRIIQQATDSNLLTGTALATTYVVIMEALAGMAHAPAN